MELLKAKGHPQARGGHRGMMDPAQQLAGMTKRYNLSADQQTQLKPILASQQQQMQALHGDSSLSREDRMTKMQSIHADTKTKIEAVLNDDQKRSSSRSRSTKNAGAHAAADARRRWARWWRTSTTVRLDQPINAEHLKWLE